MDAVSQDDVDGGPPKGDAAMTDLLDRPVAPEQDPDLRRGHADARPASSPRAGADQWFLAALLIGAGAIHVAMAPSHLNESAVEGAGFVAAAWVQVALGVAVVLGPPSRRLLVAVVGTGVALIAVWLLSRTAGLPLGSHAGHAESVSIVDGICVGLEAIAVLAAVAGLTGLAAGPLRARGVAVLGALAAAAFATAAVASPAARDHAAHSHGTHGAEAPAGHDHGDAAGAAGTDDLGFSALSNGHQHEHSDEPLTPRETVELSHQLAATAQLVQRYPTIADAEAAGWHRAGPFSPGLGTHYMGPNYVFNTDGDMDPEDLQAPMLVFDGLGPDAPLAGFMYMAYGRDTPPEGFAGPNDVWHYHEHVCIKVGPGGTIDTPFGADLEGVTAEMCTAVGGSWIANTGYMVHVWNVPGYESPDGMFTELNRRITCPDGTYHRIPIAELGTSDTVCRNT
jgi:hypothetical protein